MDHATHSQASPDRFGAGIKLAALVFILGAIAVAADLAWLAPAHSAGGEVVRVAPAPTETSEVIRYPAPATPAGAEPEAPVQAF